MPKVRQRQPPQATADNEKSKQNSGGGRLFGEVDEDGLEVKYVVFIITVVFIVTFVAALYCLGLIGNHNAPFMDTNPHQYDPHQEVDAGAPPSSDSNIGPDSHIPSRHDLGQEDLYKEPNSDPNLGKRVKHDLGGEEHPHFSHPNLHHDMHTDQPPQTPPGIHSAMPPDSQAHTGNFDPNMGNFDPNMGNFDPNSPPDMMPANPPASEPAGPPRDATQKPKSDKISPSPSSDYEPKVREKIYIPPAPADTTLDKPTILWWTEALYPHVGNGLKTEITCADGRTCLSTVHKNLLADPMTRGVMFYGTDVRSYEMPLPRQPWHEWALLHEESPQNNYLLSHAAMIRQFNHTATFNRDSHFPLTTQSIPSLEFFTERKPVPLEVKNELVRNGTLAPIVYVQSHCDVPSDRDRYVKKLMQYIPIDSYGKCVHNKDLPEELRDPVETMFDERFYDLISKYKFNLAFENAICDDYITEKLYRPLFLGSVPVTKGSARVKDWTPDDHSVVVSEEFDGQEALAEHLKFLNENDDEYLKYLEFKDTGVTNKNLIKHLKQRTWDLDGPGFILGFECYVCEKLVQRLEAEKAHEKDPAIPLMPPSIARYGHMPCAEPHVSVYPLSEAGDTSDLQAWKDDYWFNLDQALALKYMVEKGYKNAEKVFDVMDRERRRAGRP